MEKLANWYLNSPIYENGAYVAYYTSHNKGPIYPEITAYSISLSCILYKRKKEQRFLDRAETCAEYMMQINKNGLVPCFSDNLLYAFDTGIFISGILDLYALTKKEVYLNEAKKSLDGLYSLKNGKSFLAVNKVPADKEWYHTPSVHLAKLALPLLKASVYLGEEKHKLTAVKLLESYKPLQSKEGNFRIGEESEETYTHPQCYATEGLLYAYYVLNQGEFLEMAKRSADWLCRMQNSDGSLYQNYGPENVASHIKRREKMKASDATAQATRIWKLLGINRGGIEKAYSFLEHESKGGGLRLYKPTSLRGKLLDWRRPVYSWPTFFYIHSFILPFGEVKFCEELF